ncbi:retrovirus-related pol polyprotein from transposon TNT 1-94 [Tanacetum coccineum]
MPENKSSTTSGFLVVLTFESDFCQQFGSLFKQRFGDAYREVPVNETFHEPTDEELAEKELKQVESDDQGIQTILLDLPEDIYVVVDSCKTVQEIWLRVQQMMKGSDIGIQEKMAKLFNEWERFTSTDGESIESYYHRFSKLMNDFKRKKTFSKKNVGNQNGIIVVSGIANQNPNRNGNVVAARTEGNSNGNNGNQIRCYNCRELGHLAMNCTIRPRRRDDAYLQTQLLIAQKDEAGFQLQAEEFDLMAAAVDLDEIEEVNANYILIANLQQASTSGTQTDRAIVYDSDGSAENDSNVISEVSSVEQDGGTVEQHPTTVEETRAYFELLYNNLVIEVEKVNTINRKLRETNVDLTTKLARYKNLEKCFEISQEKYDKLERSYQKSVYQEQCLTKKINALHLSFGKQITTLNEEITNLNNQLSKEKSTVSSLQEEKKRLKSDFKIHKDVLLDKQIQLKNKIKELDNILQAQQKQQSLYNGKVLLEKHDPPDVYDSEETLQLAQEKAAKFVRDFKSLANEANESLAMHKDLEFKIECLLRAVASQDIMSIMQNPTFVKTSDL